MQVREAVLRVFSSFDPLDWWIVGFVVVGLTVGISSGYFRAFIPATFHDQHHRYFTGNFGGYTTIWDRLCGTMRKNFEKDFGKITTRPITRRPAVNAPEAQAVQA